MENLNAEKIKKALECCRHSDSSEEYCADCPYYTVKYCAAKISEDALALINSQEQRIKELTEVVKQSETAGGCEESVNNGFSPSVTELQRENERLRGIPEQICEKARQMCFIVGDEEYITLCELDRIAKEMLEGEAK